MSYKAVLFDLDGTLFDTSPDIIAACNRTLKAYGFPAGDEAVLMGEVMNGMQSMLCSCLPLSHRHMAARGGPMYRLFAKEYTSNAAVLTKPYAGMDSLVLTLHKNGIRTAVVSNKYLSMIRTLFKAFAFTDCFEVITGGDSCARSKPFPDPLLHTFRLMNLNPADVLYCGDAQSDIEAAFRAGCKSCAVKWGYGFKDDKLQYDPTYTASKPADLLKIVGINN